MKYLAIFLLALSTSLNGLGEGKGGLSSSELLIAKPRLTCHIPPSPGMFDTFFEIEAEPTLPTSLDFTPGVRLAWEGDLEGTRFGLATELTWLATTQSDPLATENRVRFSYLNGSAEGMCHFSWGRESGCSLLLGARYEHIRHNMGIFTSGSDYSHHHHLSWGIGPSVGLAAHQQLGYGFYVTGVMRAMVLLGEGVARGGHHYYSEGSEFLALIGSDWRCGLGWEGKLKQGRSVGFEMGGSYYEQGDNPIHGIVRALSSAFSRSASPHDLEIMGFYARLSFCY